MNRYKYNGHEVDVRLTDSEGIEVNTIDNASFASMQVNTIIGICWDRIGLDTDLGCWYMDNVFINEVAIQD